MSEAKHTPEIAKYKLQIKSNTGYSSTTTGECTPEQYSAAIAAIDSACSSKLVRAAPDLLEALELVMDRLVDKHEDDIAAQKARAAIAKATGGAAC